MSDQSFHFILFSYVYVHRYCSHLFASASFGIYFKHLSHRLRIDHVPCVDDCFSSYQFFL